MKAVVLLSGGMDSTVLAAHLLSQGADVHALGFDYGQRHVRELQQAQAVASVLGIRFDVVQLGVGAMLRGSSQTDMSVPVPEGHYTDASMAVTVVPNRNMMMLSVAAAVAIAERRRTIAYAAHAGDHAIYPDCRLEFVLAMHDVLSYADHWKVELAAPFLAWDKGQIARRGVELGAPLHLTWSCYKAGVAHCGRCGTCVERREAFATAGIKDPTEYEGGS